MKLTEFPQLVKEWHPTKNGDLTPEDVTHGSNKKVWWLCPKGHSYESAIASRTSNKTGCPYCSGNKVGDDNNLEFLYPEIAKEWHPTKNGKLTPRDITPNSTKRIWWLCSNGHSYDAKSNVRVSMKTNCPYCSGRKVGDDNNLEFVHPEIAKEWHPTKNNKLSPREFTRASTKRVWWLCPKGHSYEATIHNRTAKKGTGCPICTNQTSEPEIRILSELRWIFNEVKSRYKVDGVEVDIFLPKYKIGVEYDGKHWHKDKEVSDIEKNNILKSYGIRLIRVREKPLKLLSEQDISVGRVLDKSNLDEILKSLYQDIENETQSKIDEYFEMSEFINEKLFKKYRSYFPYPFPENSIKKTHPVIASEWDFDKNYPLIPENFSYGSGHNLWWVCPNGHSYKRSLNARTSQGLGCPYCSGRRSLTPDLFES